MHRRTVLASVASGALAGAAGFGRSEAAAQAAAVDLSAHPMAGTWLAMANQAPDAPQVAVPSVLAADGSVLLVFPPTEAGPQGVVFGSAYTGTWEADGERRAHFTAVRVLSDLTGAFLGSVTVDGYPEASEDGMTFVDDGSRVVITVRDPAGAVVQQFPDTSGRPVTGIRMGPGQPGFPAGDGEAATPTA